MSTVYATPARPLRAAVEALVAGGVRDVIICPGSRSTPMALALRTAPELASWVHLDERAGAFFALGAAKASRRPVAVLATSGTAVVNFAPAVAEARYGRVPLVLLTADRPPELQGVGAPQTIDQTHLYGRHAKWFVGLPVPEDSVQSEREVGAAFAAAIEVARSAPAGPVQINLPFREALVPDGPLRGEQATGERAAPGVPTPGPRVDPAGLERVADQLADAARPLIVCGPLDSPGFAPAIAGLASATQLPLLADGLSNVRCGEHDRSHVISHYDALLRSEPFLEAHRADFVLRFGARPTSKVLDGLLEAWDVPQVLVDAGGGWQQPLGTRLVDADPVAFAEALAGATGHRPSAADRAWLASWQGAEARAATALDGWFGDVEEPFEGSVARALDAALPSGAIILAGNSMPVRDVDAFLPSSPRSRRLLGNRGVNGIDGSLSTAFGAALTQPEPVVAVVGDVSFLHDLNALVAAARLGVDATIVLVNNDGGGIFSFLPQASSSRPDAGLPEHYEELFGTPHGIEFGPLVKALGGRHEEVRGLSLGTASSAAIERPGVDVLEMRTERARNVSLHRDAIAAIVRALEAPA